MADEPPISLELSQFYDRLFLTEDPDSLDTQARGIAWARVLNREINDRAPVVWLLRRYFGGEQPIRFATEAWRETFGEEFGPLTDNWCRIVIEAATERMGIQAFRLGNQANEKIAWDLWKRSRMTLDADIAHTDSLVTGYSYTMAWPDDDGQPEITVEDPLHCMVILDPANRRRRLAGMKRWRTIDGRWEAMVFTPDHWWHIEINPADGGKSLNDGAHDLGVVPIIPLTNCPDIYGIGYSDLTPILPLQDAINKLLSDEMIASEFAAFRQRVLLGVEIPEDEDGEPVFDLQGGINRWLAFEGENAKIQELSANDLKNYQDAVEQFTKHIAALTRTPPYYLLGDMINVSADAITAADAGLVQRVKRRDKLAGETWEETIKLAFTILGDPGAADDIETVWSDPEIISEAAKVDALVKAKTLNLPDVLLWEKYGLTPREIERALKLRKQQAQEEGLRLGITPSGAPVEPPPTAAPAPDEPVAAAA